MTATVCFNSVVTVLDYIFSINNTYYHAGDRRLFGKIDENPHTRIVKSGETVAHQEFTTEALTDESTTVPPFFNKTYDLEGGSLTLRAGGESDNLMVSVDYQINEDEIELSALLYMEIYIQTGSFAQRVDTLMFTVHDSKYENSGYTTYLNGQIYIYEDPPFYGKDYDYSEDGSFDKEKHLRISSIVDEAFTELKGAIE